MKTIERFSFCAVLALLAGCGSEASPNDNGLGAGGSSAMPSAGTAGIPSGGTETSGGQVGTANTAGSTAGGTAGTAGTGGAARGGADPQGGAGADAGGTAGTGGAAMGGAGAGGVATQGGTAGADAGGAGGMGGTGGAPGGALPLGNMPVPSTGCGAATTVTSGEKTITSDGRQRAYIIDIPSDYDMNEPHRVVYASHWIDGHASQVSGSGFYQLKPLAAAAGVPVIFIAPESTDGRWHIEDHMLFDDILAHVKENLCIDTTRVFATGFSFGGMITYSLSTNHQTDIRAAVGIAPANYNIDLPEKTGQPIAWMQTTGMSDGRCPWVEDAGRERGSKFIAIEHATNNGCDVPDDIPTWQNGEYLCYDFEGCPEEYPVKACTFDGGHNNPPRPGATWVQEESWDFFMQF